jgi:hypothetical protein
LGQAPVVHRRILAPVFISRIPIFKNQSLAKAVSKFIGVNPVKSRFAGTASRLFNRVDIFFELDHYLKGSLIFGGMIMKNILNLGNATDLLALLMLIKEKKPLVLYYDNYGLFVDGKPQEDLIKILTLANLSEIQIIIQKNQVIDGISFWKHMDDLRSFLRTVSGPLGLCFQTGDITPAIPEGPDSGSQKTIFIRLRPNSSLFQQD